MPLLLAICRFGQGFGLGGEWGGAVLLATENAPEGKRSWYGMFPQLGAPVGLFLSSAVFWLLLHFISQKDFITWGWRVPFIASIILIGIGLWVRLSITETPELGEAGARKERVAVPVVEILLLVQIVASVFFGIFCPIAGKLSDRFGRRTVLVATTVAIGVFSFFLQTLLTGGLTEIYIFAAVSMALAGMTYGPIGTAMAAPFPVAVRYTGASITFNFAGIFGASLAPFIAAWLASNYGLPYVGYYMAIAAFITLVCIMLSGNEEI